ncbi:universal stress protein [Streptomyces sp. NPDC058326]|uniref:universal stress protein n=1 Tax=Streptomyces sp. NPDC058326 TaxID=3346447 RepID=UPI0036EB3B25
MIRPVTVGVDGAPECVAAAEWAARESVLRGVPLRVVYVDPAPNGADVPHSASEAPRLWAENLLAVTVETVRREHPSLEIEARHLSGQPAEVLAEEGADAGLLVLGSRGLSGVKGFLLGSVGMVTLHATERPVVFVRAPGPDAPEQAAHSSASRTVVVGVDLDQFFAPLVDFAFQEAAVRGGRVLALYGWRIPPVVRDASALVAAEREMGPDMRRRLTEGLKPWRQRFPSVELGERSRVGGPAQLLLDCAQEAGLVVVGRRVRRASLGTHIGPVTHAVIHHCAVPVAVISHD